MRWTVVWTVLSAGLVACTSDGNDALEDAGNQAHADAAQPNRDAADDDTHTDGESEGGQVDTLDAAAASEGGTSSSADARASDARQDAPSSSGTDGGGSSASGCAGKAYKLCEDFEGAKVGGLPSSWMAVPGWASTGSALVADDEHHSGGMSLKGALAASGQARAGTSLSALGATANKHWGRIFYKVKSPATLPPAVDPPDFGVIHNTLVGLKGSTESRVVDTVVNTSGKHQFLYNLPDDSCCTGSDYLYASYDGKWHCAEWYVDASMQQFRFFYDSAEVKIGFTYGAAETKAHIGKYAQIIVGWINYQTPKMPYNQAWFDDLAIDDNRIGCN